MLIIKERLREKIVPEETFQHTFDSRLKVGFWAVDR